MESTGVYWIPLYEILEAAVSGIFGQCSAFEKRLGRKTDILDCQWIQQLHTYGLLSPSFRPPEQIVALRSLVRHRAMLVQYRSAHVQHMQKALTQMNLRLTNVLTDITGVTGMQIIRAILAGERNPQVLAEYRQPGCKKTVPKSPSRWKDTTSANTGLPSSRQWNCMISMTARCATARPSWKPCTRSSTHWKTPVPTTRSRTSKRNKNQPTFDLASALYRLTGVDLTQIDGIDELTVQKVLSETGTDMSRWPTVKRLRLLAALVPKQQDHRWQSHSNRGTTDPEPGKHSFAGGGLQPQAQRLCFGSLLSTNASPAWRSAAITATAHKLARIIYFMLKERKPYHDFGADYYEQQYRTQILRNLNRRAAKLGFRLEPVFMKFVGSLCEAILLHMGACRCLARRWPVIASNSTAADRTSFRKKLGMMG